MRRFEPEAANLLHVADRMREWDRREVFATMWEDDTGALVRYLLSFGQVRWVVGLDEPIAAFGCAPLWPGCWSMWLFATDDFHRIGLGVTRMVIRSIVPMLWGGGARRLECRSMEGHVDAQRWLCTIGASREATLRSYGKGGEDFHVYTWVKP